MIRASLASVAMLVVASVCMAEQAPDAGPVNPDNPAATASTPAAEFSATLDAYWVTRDNPESIKQQNLAIAKGLQAYPNDYQLLWRAARYKSNVADGQDAEHKTSKKAVAKEAWAYADRALKIKPEGIEGHYYKALAIGAYAEAIGIVTALLEGIEGQFVEHLDYALKANEAFDRAGPVRVKGRYYAQLPWPKRDREKAIQLLNKAIKLSPEATRSYLFLAEVLLQAGKPEEARTALKKVYALTPDYDQPEGRRVLGWAKSLAQEIEAERE